MSMQPTTVQNMNRSQFY